jgi:PEGA domain
VVVKVTGKNGDVGDALIVVDGKEVATGTLATVPLDPGSHEVQVRKGGFATSRTLINVEEATPMQLTLSLVQERVELWPVALGVGLVGAAMLGTGLVMIDHAAALQSGSSPLNFIWGKKAADSYLTKAPITETELCAKANEIWFFAGRAPQDGVDLFPDDAFAGEPDKQGVQPDGWFAQDRCGVSGSPGVGGWLALGSTVPLTAAAILEIADIISAATAE